MKITTMLSIAFVFVLIAMSAGLVYGMAEHEHEAAACAIIVGGIALTFIIVARSEFDGE